MRWGVRGSSVVFAYGRDLVRGGVGGWWVVRRIVIAVVVVVAVVGVVGIGVERFCDHQGRHGGSSGFVGGGGTDTAW